MTKDEKIIISIHLMAFILGMLVVQVIVLLTFF